MPQKVFKIAENMHYVLHACIEEHTTTAFVVFNDDGTINHWGEDKPDATFVLRNSLDDRIKYAGNDDIRAITEFNTYTHANKDNTYDINEHGSYKWKAKIDGNHTIFIVTGPTDVLYSGPSLMNAWLHFHTGK